MKMPFSNLRTVPVPLIEEYEWLNLASKKLNREAPKAA
jgi:hypothetical protein